MTSTLPYDPADFRTSESDRLLAALLDKKTYPDLAIHLDDESEFFMPEALRSWLVGLLTRCRIGLNVAVTPKDEEEDEEHAN